MEFRLLGPVQALTEGRVVPLKERKQRLVLAVLLLEANQLVPIDRLVDLLWMHDPPSSARRIVQAHLSRLRTTLEALDRATRLTRYGTCYMLVCEPESIDVHLFRGLLERARRTSDDRVRAEALLRASALWRGPALADAATDRLRRELCGGLEEARLAAVEDRVDAELRLGNHAAVLDDLTDLHTRHPTRIKPAAQLMTALHRSGRSSEALQVFLRTRDWLRTELGVDPTAELDRLYTAILRNDPALDPPRPVPDAAPPGSDALDGLGGLGGLAPTDVHGPARTAARAPGHPRYAPAVRPDVDRELELIAAQRGVGVSALVRQIVEEWVLAQQWRVRSPDHLVELMRHLDEARQAAATLAHQTAHPLGGAAA